MYLKHKSDHHIFLSKTLWWLFLTFRVNLNLEGPSWLGLICHLLPLPAYTFSNTQLFSSSPSTQVFSFWCSSGHAISGLEHPAHLLMVSPSLQDSVQTSHHMGSLPKFWQRTSPLHGCDTWAHSCLSSSLKILKWPFNVCPFIWL